MDDLYLFDLMIMYRLRILNIKAGLREDFEKKPFYIKDVVLCLGHMYKPFQIIKIGLDLLRGGVREGQNLPKNGLNLALEPSRGP